jgi:hypothetical protein
MLHPTSLHGDLEKKLPALRLVIRDTAHATRRITEWTISADSRLNHIMNTIVHGIAAYGRLPRCAGAPPHLHGARPVAAMLPSAHPLEGI